MCGTFDHDAEYMALASAAHEAFWMRQLLTDLKNRSGEPTRSFLRQPINPEELGMGWGGGGGGLGT